MSPEASIRAGRSRSWKYPLWIGLAILLVFGRVVGHGFLAWDDLVNTVGNPHVNPPSLEGTLYFWRHAYMDLYVPATFTLWALLARIALDPALFHGANLVLHAAAAMAAFGLLRRLVRNEKAAFAGALLFALHPVQTEAVAWMSGAKDLLCGLFSFLALARYADFAGTEGGRNPRWRAFARATAFFVLALLSKPAAVAVPLLAGVIDLGFFGRPGRERVQALAAWTAIALAWIAVASASQPAVEVAKVPLVARPLVAGDALAFYVGKILFPLHLAPDYGRDPAWLLEKGPALATSLAVLAAAVVLLVAILRARSPEGGDVRPRRSVRWIAAAAGILVSGTAPVLGLVTFDFQKYSTVSDHYLYVAMLGPALLVSAWIAQNPGTGSTLAVSAVLVLCAGKSGVQAGVWRDDESLWRHTLEVNPRSWAAHDNLGQALEASGRVAESLPEFELALSIHPGNARTHFNYGTALDELDRTAEALPHLEEAVRLSPEDRPSRENLGIALLRAADAERAEPQLRKAVAIDPGSWLAHYYLAGALDRLDRPDEMLVHLREAVRLNPRFGPARSDLDAVLRAQAEAK